MPGIQDVWEDNLEAEMAMMREVVEEYPFIAMDTEFPGVVVKPVGQFKSAAQFHYEMMRRNCEVLNMIQLGLTFMNERGETAPDTCTWQIHFKFDLSESVYAEDSIRLLQRSGINFDDHRDRGIDPLRFGALLMTSGLVLSPSVRWITFHGGYDFGYLLRLATCKTLPRDELAFRQALTTYFSRFYDIKYLLRHSDGLHGGLKRIAEAVGCKREGPAHQAGSDSLLTARLFVAIRDRVLGGSIPEGDSNVLYGLRDERGAAGAAGAAW